MAENLNYGYLKMVPIYEYAQYVIQDWPMAYQSPQVATFICMPALMLICGCSTIALYCLSFKVGMP